MKVKNDLYFENIDATWCQPLEYFLHDARIEGIKEITLLKAVPDDGTEDIIWCNHYGDAVEKSGCKKSECLNYKSKSGRGRCANKGSLYFHGEKVKFQVIDTEVIA